MFVIAIVLRELDNGQLVFYSSSGFIVYFHNVDKCLDFDTVTGIVAFSDFYHYIETRKKELQFAKTISQNF